MTTFSVHQAKTHLSRLIVYALRGKDVAITRDGRPVARLVPLQAAKTRRAGRLKERLALTPPFFDPLPADELDARTGESMT